MTARRALGPLVASPAGLAGWPASREKLPEAALPAADQLVAALGDARETTSAGAAAETLREALGPLVEARYADGAVRLQDLDRLVEAARNSSDLGHFTAELVLDAPQSSGELAGPPHLDEDYLVLSTVHSAKGLEWESVHVLALYDGNFPADMACGSGEGIEEERRLLYVAFTRARQRLALYVPVRYYHHPKGNDDTHGYGKPSRFLTAEVQGTCEVITPADGEATTAKGFEQPRRKIEVSVDELFC